MKTRRQLLKMAGVGAMAAATSGCWLHFNYRHGPPIAGRGVVYIDRAPPPPPRRRVPPRPIPGAVWIDGYWRWSGVQFVWVDGYWDRSPPPGRVWRQGRWIHTNRGWYWEEGGWR